MILRVRHASFQRETNSSFSYPQSSLLEECMVSRLAVAEPAVAEVWSDRPGGSVRTAAAVGAARALREDHARTHGQTEAAAVQLLMTMAGGQRRR